MATLTPGILLRLLQSMYTNTKPTGEHRSAVLQVTSILPAAAASNTPLDLDLWHNHGFLLQLSDSKNSTYVSLSHPDTDLILSNRLQLGQFVYLDRFLIDDPNGHDALSLPVAYGLRPLPGRHPFVGTPERLAVKFQSGSSRDYMIYPVKDDDEQVPSFVRQGRKVLAPRVNDDNVHVNANVVNVEVKKKAATVTVTPQRFRSPGVKKERAVSVRKERDPSPATKVKRSASPVPSKCAVPSLVAAKEESRRAAREAAIVVPSRYRQPSPTAVGRRAASPSTRRLSVSPARRLSCGGSSGNKKKIAAAIAAGIGGMKMDAKDKSGCGGGRKSWDDVAGGAEVKEKASGGGKGKPDVQAIIRTQAAMSRRLSDANSLDSRDDSSTDGKAKSNSNEDSLTPNKLPALAAGITIYDKKWTDGSVPFDTVSSGLAKLGKEAIQRRITAANAAAEALQEALATESIVRSLSMFSDLCSTSKAGNPLPTIDRFLSIYENAIKSATNVNSVSSSHCSEIHDGTTTTDQSKSATSWVEAALSTDLAIVSLLTGQSVDPLPTLPRSSSSKRQSIGNTTKNHSKASQMELPKGQWTRGLGMKDTAELASKLKSEMELWFLKFVEESLEAGFRVFSECGSTGNRKVAIEGGSIAAILSQLKRINDWLDLVVKKRDEMLTEKIERLKRKIYGFVIQHVGTTLDSPSFTS